MQFFHSACKNNMIYKNENSEITYLLPIKVTSSIVSVPVHGVTPVGGHIAHAGREVTAVRRETTPCCAPVPFVVTTHLFTNQKEKSSKTE